MASSAAVAPTAASTIRSSRSARSIALHVRAIPSGGLPQTRGIHEVQRDALDLHRLAHGVARGTWRRGYDRQVLACETVEQARLADIRLPREDDVQSGAQQAALLRAVEGVRERGPQPVQPPARVGAVERVELFLGKVEGRLNERSQLDQLGDEPVDRRGELPLQAADGAARGRLGSRLDEVRDRLGLREIEPVVEERAARELARLREARAELEAPAQQELQHDRAAVTLQLEDVLAGVGMRRRKIERDPVVDRPTCGVAKARARRAARLRQLSEQLDCKARESRTGDADHADAGVPLRRRDRRDRVGRVQRFAVAGLSFPPSIMRVICHCCPIDRMLLTSQ
jgi:hypothetical protein